MPPVTPIALDQLNEKLERLSKTAAIARHNLEVVPKNVAEKYAVQFQILTCMIDSLKRKILLEYPKYVPMFGPNLRKNHD
jgi:hypothetical protein